MTAVDPGSGDDGDVDAAVPDALDRIRFVSRSPVRVRLLAALREGGHLSRNDLRTRLDASRTTVTRNVEALCEQGLVRNGGTDYTLTRVGELIAADVLDLAETIAVARELAPFLEWVPEGALDIDLRHFAEAEVIVAKPGDPWAMINRQVRSIKRMDYSWGFLPFTGLHATEANHERVVDHGAEGELVLTPEIADVHFSDPNYAPLTEEVVETGRFEYFRYDGELPYALVEIDGVVQIVVADGDQPRAMVESDNEAVREWAKAKYESYKRESERITRRPTPE